MILGLRGFSLVVLGRKGGDLAVVRRMARIKREGCRKTRTGKREGGGVLLCKFRIRSWVSDEVCQSLQFKRLHTASTHSSISLECSSPRFRSKVFIAHLLSTDRFLLHDSSIAPMHLAPWSRWQPDQYLAYVPCSSSCPPPLASPPRYP